MHYTSVTFDRVFDIVSGQLNREPVTWFGFQCGESKHYGIPAPGNPRIQAGDSITACLKERDNWQTIVGWVNLDTGEITMRPTFNELAVFSGMLFIFVIVASSMPMVIRFGVGALIFSFGFAALRKVVLYHGVRRHLLVLAKTTPNPAFQRTASGGR